MADTRTFEIQPDDYLLGEEVDGYDLHYEVIDDQERPIHNISYDIDIGLPYGQMPFDALVSKFEETMDGVTEDAYENYARDTLRDMGPDPRTFESEQVQRNNDSRGFLNHRYYGTRSGQEVQHPEINTELVEKDPRRSFTDPDMRKMTEQNNFRTRYIRFDKVANEDRVIPEGSKTNARLREERVLGQNWAKNQFKFFSTAKDGRREGMRRSYEHRPEVVKQSAMYKYGDHIRDWALNPQRQTVVHSNEIASKSRLLRHQFEPDHEFKIAKYGEAPRSATQYQNEHLLRQTTCEANYPFAGGDYFAYDEGSKTFKQMGQLMGAIVEQKHAAEQDMDYSDAQILKARKMERQFDDLNILLYRTKNEMKFANSDQTQRGKMAPLQIRGALSTYSTTDNIKPANITMNAAPMYKSVQPGADFEKIRKEIVSDNKAQELRDEQKNMRTGRQEHSNQFASKKNSHFEVDGESKNVHIFKNAGGSAKGQNKKNYSGEGFAMASDPNMNRKFNPMNYNNPNPELYNTNMSFSGNKEVTRFGGTGVHASRNNHMIRNNLNDDNANTIADLN